jgi:hypothetical protein
MGPVGGHRRREEKILKRKLKKLMRVCGLDQSFSGEGSATGCCEHGNEPALFLKRGEFLEWLNN